MDKKYDFSLSYEALTRVCENAICEHIRRAGSLEGLGFALEYTKAYAILEVWSLLAATAIHFQLSLRKTEYIYCS
ncbi:Uncharacterised protein [Klebsiella pneumoniae]|uniref:hypothetical protein n=1 Tax=Klebsiella pneumoniae TaxID=573 RepID=UPI000E2A7FD9|nr:hypothetical protein [Klebsiella pneumoniae]SYC79419.1 Uncharacterised protein [Klebsiella pneumoniae]